MQKSGPQKRAALCFGGSMWESNPPRTLLTPNDWF